MRLHTLTLAAVLAGVIGVLIAATLMRETSEMPQRPRAAGALPIEGGVDAFDFTFG